MSRRNKLEKFQDLARFEHVFENFNAKNPIITDMFGKEIEVKSKWDEVYFKNGNNIVLELACGRGEYSVGLGEKYPDKNFIGVDIKGSRIWTGARLVIEKEMKNVAFLRTRIELIDNYFGKDEISEIWITFPDPFLRDSKVNRRLTSENFLKRYRKILKKGGIIHLKTDSPELYEFTLEELGSNVENKILYHSNDIYASDLETSALELKTRYEVMHLAKGLKIKYVKFTIS